MTDTHCHLYSEEFASDIAEVMQRAEDAGVCKFYLPAIDKSTSAAMFGLEQKYPLKCFAMIGLHPCSVNDNYRLEIDFIKTQLEQRSFAGIGEAGLDFYWDVTYKAEQYQALHEQIQFALQYNLPLVLHTRNATQETIDVVKSYEGQGLRGIFHCFGGTLPEALQIIQLKFLLGIGGVVTYKNAGLAEVLKEVDLSNIVLETDAPYLSPVPYRGKRNESSYLVDIAKKIADVKKITVAELDKITTANADNLFAH